MKYLKKYLLVLELWSEELPAKLVLEERAKGLKARLKKRDKTKSLKEQLDHVFGNIVDHGAVFTEAAVDLTFDVILERFADARWTRFQAYRLDGLWAMRDTNYVMSKVLGSVEIVPRRASKTYYTGLRQDHGVGALRRDPPAAGRHQGIGRAARSAQ